MRLFPSAIGVGLLWLGASCSDNARPPPAGFGNGPSATGGDSGGGRGGSGGKGGQAGKGGKGGSTNGGASGDGSLAGQSGDNPGGEGGTGNRGGGMNGAGNLGANGGGGNETAEGGALLTGPDIDCPKLDPTNGGVAPVCNPKASWAAGAPVIPHVGGADYLESISPDELSVAWSYQDALAPVLYVADRTNVGDDFGEPQQIQGQGGVAATQLALGPDRLRLVAVLGGQFIEFERATTTDTFVYAGAGHFAAINADAGERAATLSDPVFAADDTTLYYSLHSNAFADGPTIFVSKRGANDDWVLGSPLDECELTGATTGSRRPTGISADQRTLFYYDELRVSARAAWRPTPESPFDTFVDLTDRKGVQANAACDSLYYSEGTDDGLAVLVSAEK